MGLNSQIQFEPVQPRDNATLSKEKIEGWEAREKNENCIVYVRVFNGSPDKSTAVDFAERLIKDSSVPWDKDSFAVPEAKLCNALPYLRVVLNRKRSSNENFDPHDRLCWDDAVSSKPRPASEACLSSPFAEQKAVHITEIINHVKFHDADQRCRDYRGNYADKNPRALWEWLQILEIEDLGDEPITVANHQLEYLGVILGLRWGDVERAFPDHVDSRPAIGFELGDSILYP